MDTTRRARSRFHRAVIGGAVVVGLSTAGTAPSGAATPPPPRSIDAFCADVPAGYQPFSDVGSSVFGQAIRCQAAAEITKGVSANTYAPGAWVSRDQMASFIARMIDEAVALHDGNGPPLRALPAYDGSNAFIDVNADDTHVESINRLAAVGITQGGPGGRPTSYYEPWQLVTREQMASYVARALAHLRGSATPVGDDYFVDDATSSHEVNINSVASEGIAVGVGGSRFQPEAALTREQLSAFIVRSLASLLAEGRITPVAAGDLAG